VQAQARAVRTFINSGANKLLRYQAANDKQLQQALERLAHLQRRRQAEAHAEVGDAGAAAN